MLNTTVVSKDTYFVTVEIQEFYGVKKDQYTIHVEKGKRPTIGDFSAMFKHELGIDVEISEIQPYLEFRPIAPVHKGIQRMRVTRTTNGTPYVPATLTRNFYRG